MKMLKTAGDPSDDIISGDDTKVKSGSAAFWLIVPFFHWYITRFCGSILPEKACKTDAFSGS